MTPQIDLAQRLLLRAARSAPPALAARLEEEWLADLASRAGTCSRLRLAIGCCWATGIITREFSVPQLATFGAGGNVRTFLGALHDDFPLLSRRTVFFVAIVGVHALLIYGFTSGLAQHVFPSLVFPTSAVVIQEERLRPAPPPAIPLVTQGIAPKLDFPAPPPFEIPTATPTPGTEVGPQVTHEPPGQPPAAIHRQIGSPGPGFPNTDDFYPAASRRLGETGAATVQVCVDTHGRLTGEPVVTQGSGLRRLDEGALNLARAGSGHYRPSTENGQPVVSCYDYRIRFRLDDR